MTALPSAELTAPPTLVPATVEARAAAMRAELLALASERLADAFSLRDEDAASAA